jgi:hypothetical protein
MGDWGIVDQEDWAANDYAVSREMRLLSAYSIPTQLRDGAPDPKVWVITEADRSSTTVLFPSDY